MNIYQGKPYDYFLLVMRAQHIQKGHESLINTGFKFCDRGLVLVGSAQESGTIENPFDISTRIDMIRAIYGDALIIKPLNDLTHGDDITPAWGDYVLENVRRHMGVNPPVMVYGGEERRSKWFSEEALKDSLEIIVPRSKLPISATMCREALAKGERELWMSMVNQKLWKHYDRLRAELLSVEYYKNLVL